MLTYKLWIIFFCSLYNMQNLFLLLLLVGLGGCHTQQQKPANTLVKPTSANFDKIPESANKEDEPSQKDNEIENSQKNKLEVIRKNFHRINSISDWSTIKKTKIDIGEGGEISFYYQQYLEKIIVREFGETYQRLAEYYLKEGVLSFVFERSYKYNRPFYYDSTAMKKNDDSEVFDFSKSSIEAIRSYFENETLIHQIKQPDTAPLKIHDTEAQSRLITDFQDLLEIGQYIESN